MKQSGIHLTIIAALVIAMSIGLAAVLSMLTPAVIEGENPGDSGISQPADEDLDTAQEDDPQPIPPAPNGGHEGGNTDAVKSGRLPNSGYEDTPINNKPDNFVYLLSPDVTLESPDAVGNIKVENNPGNTCPMQLCFYREDTGELVYTSAMIQPDEYIDGDSLSVKLKKGEYKINAVISVYDEATTELKTTFHEAVTLTVHQKFLGIF